MNTVRKTVLFFTILSIHTILWAQTNLASRALTYEEAQKLTYDNSPIVKQMGYLKTEKTQEKKATLGYFAPKIGIIGGYTFMSSDLHLDLTPVRDAILPLYQTQSSYGMYSGILNPDPKTNKFMKYLPDTMATRIVRGKLSEAMQKVEEAEWDKTIQKKQFGVIAATGQLPLYVGGKIRAARKAALIEEEDAMEIGRQKTAELTTELVERYYGLCLAQQSVAVRSDVYFGMQKHLDDAIKMGNQGLIANADVLHAKVYHAQASRDLNNSRRTVAILNQALLNTLNLDSTESVEAVSGLFYLDTIEPLNIFVQAAKTNSPLLKQVESKRLLAKQNMRVHRSDMLPQIALMGSYNLIDKDLSPYMPNWTAGVTMRWTIFDGMQAYHKTKAASFKEKQAEEYFNKAESDIESMINRLYQELNMYHEQLNELNTAREFAEEYLNVRQKAFKGEMANATEVVDAQLALSKVNIERLQAMYNYDLTLAKLLQYSGISDQFNTYRTRQNAHTENYVPINK